MTRARVSPVSATIEKSIDDHNPDLKTINHKIHECPELGYNEHHAHDSICSMLSKLGYKIEKHVYSLPTSFSVEYGSGGRVVTFNAEYDALPDIGHACGHNLIATASIGAFLGTAAALKKYKVPGRVRLLGTPAEEGGGGKVKLIDAGAYKDVDACLMVHPAPGDETGAGGNAHGLSLANTKFRVHYTGKPAHAAVAPWEGVNALDAVVLAYNGISALRQQIRPYERIHGVISEGGARPNIITARASLDYYIRSTTLEEARKLRARAKGCFDGAAMQTGCTVEYEELNEYADLRPNKTICLLYADAMGSLGSPVECDFESECTLGSTDMGNVTYEVPGFHGIFGIPAPDGASNHTPGFTGAAGTDRAHDLAIVTSKGLAIAAWKILTDDKVAADIKRDFEEDKRARLQPRIVQRVPMGGCC